MRPVPPPSTAILAALVLAAPLPGAVAPGNLRIAFPLLASNSIELSWEDNSDDEDSFEFEFSTDGGGSWFPVGSARRNQTLVSTITGYQAGVTIHARVRAKSDSSGDSEWSEPASKTFPATPSPPIWIRSGTFHGGMAGSPLTVDPPTVFGTPPTEYSATDLPSGMVLDSGTGVVSGVPGTAGVFRPIVTVTEGTFTASTFVTFRIVEAGSGPVVSAPVPEQVVLAGGGPVLVELGDHFRDPDTGEAVRIVTNAGVVDTILHPRATPATVENFLNYVDRGDYDGVVFHRSAVVATSGVDVVQAGLLRGDGAGYVTIPRDANVVDEPALSNLAGSFAMAKTGDPDSGSSQWYFNVIDNTNLDGPQSNGGYTVFGRAATPSLPVLAAMHALPRGNYTIEVNGGPVPFNDWPTVSGPAGAAPTAGESLRIASIRRLAPLAFGVHSVSDPSLVAASVAGTQLVLRAPAGARGPASVELGIGDLDGHAITATVAARVLNPGLGAGRSPAGRFAVTFNHEKSVAGLSYHVQRSPDLAGWTTFWRTSDGLDAPEVAAVTDLGSQWRLTVEDPSAVPPGTAGSYLRVVAGLGP